MGCSASSNGETAADKTEVQDFEDEDDEKDGLDLNSAAAKLALRRASKGVVKEMVRTLTFEADKEGPRRASTRELEVTRSSPSDSPRGSLSENLSDDEPLSPGTRNSAAARLLARKVSKREVQAAHRLSIGCEALEWGETPEGVRQSGIILTNSSAESLRRSTSKGGAGVNSLILMTRSSSKQSRTGSKAFNSNNALLQQLSSGSLSPIGSRCSSKASMQRSLELSARTDVEEPQSGYVVTSQMCALQKSKSSVGEVNGDGEPGPVLVASIIGEPMKDVTNVSEDLRAAANAKLQPTVVDLA